MAHAELDWERGFPVEISNLSIWTDVQGPDDGPAVVLLAGADSPGFRWSPALVDPLVAEGFRVVRFDHRDCGRSTLFGTDAAYTLGDMAADTLGLLDCLGIQRAHLIGRSMGAAIAQVLALDAPDRVVSLTLVGATPGAGDERLPGPADDFVEAMTERLFEGAPTEREARERWIVDLHRELSGPLYRFDESVHADLARAELRAGWAPETGHGVAVYSSVSRLDRLGSIDSPTLVVHGTADPVYPPEHGRALAGGVPGAVLIEIEGLGHEFPDALVVDLWPALRLHLIESEGWAHAGDS